jgi:hypothetical protein
VAKNISEQREHITAKKKYRAHRTLVQRTLGTKNMDTKHATKMNIGHKGSAQRILSQEYWHNEYWAQDHEQGIPEENSKYRSVKRVPCSFPDP